MVRFDIWEGAGSATKSKYYAGEGTAWTALLLDQSESIFETLRIIFTDAEYSYRYLNVEVGKRKMRHAGLVKGNTSGLPTALLKKYRPRKGETICFTATVDGVRVAIVSWNLRLAWVGLI